LEIRKIVPLSLPKYKVSLKEALVIVNKTYTFWTVDLQAEIV